MGGSLAGSLAGSLPVAEGEAEAEAEAETEAAAHGQCNACRCRCCCCFGRCCNQGQDRGSHHLVCSRCPNLNLNLKSSTDADADADADAVGTRRRHSWSDSVLGPPGPTRIHGRCALLPVDVEPAGLTAETTVPQAEWRRGGESKPKLQCRFQLYSDFSKRMTPV